MCNMCAVTMCTYDLCIVATVVFAWLILYDWVMSYNVTVYMRPKPPKPNANIDVYMRPKPPWFKKAKQQLSLKSV